MENEIYVEGLGIADGVIDTIVLLSTTEVAGVAGVGSAATHPIVVRNRRGGKQAMRTGIDIRSTEEGLCIKIRLQVIYGYRLTDVAQAVRQSVASAVTGQTGVKVRSVDIFIDGVVFAE